MMSYRHYNKMFQYFMGAISAHMVSSSKSFFKCFLDKYWNGSCVQTCRRGSFKLTYFGVNHIWNAIWKIVQRKQDALTEWHFWILKLLNKRNVSLSITVKVYIYISNADIMIVPQKVISNWFPPFNKIIENCWSYFFRSTSYS